MVFHGSFSFILAAKLKTLKGILKVWNREVFSRVETNKLEALRRVSYWDDLEKERELGLEEHEGRSKAKDDFKSLALMKEISWRQKSKETWLKEGDKNTRFFHRMENGHRRRNFLQSLSINGRRLVKEDEIKEGLVNAFQNLFSTPNYWCPPLPGLSFNVTGPEEASKVEEVFTKKEI